MAVGTCFALSLAIEECLIFGEMTIKNMKQNEENIDIETLYGSSCVTSWGDLLVSQLGRLKDACVETYGERAWIFFRWIWNKRLHC